MLDNKPGVAEYDNAIILPCRKNYKDKSWGDGGIVRANGEFIKESGLYMKWISFGGPYSYDKSKIAEVNDNVIWFGFFYKHWGHFLLDFLGRMWYLIDNYNGEEIFYTSHGHTIDGNFMEFFKLLGIDPCKIKRVSSVTKVNNIVVPEYARNEVSYTNEYARIFQNIAHKVLSKSSIEDKSFFLGKSIYLSRAMFASATVKEIGEDKVESAFVSAGFQTLYPEKMTLSEQVLLWNLSTQIACVNGTIPLNYLFCNNKELKLIVLNKTKLRHKNLEDVLEIQKCSNYYSLNIFEPRFLWASKNIGDGPFVLKVTTELRNFLGMGKVHKTGDDFLYLLKGAFFVVSFKIRNNILSLCKRVVKKIIAKK